MAQEINSIINSLTSMKPKIEKLAKNNELINIIDDLNDLIADAESFGGVIKQLVPVQLKAQVDALTGVYNQLKTISKSASSAVDNIIDNVDNIPIGQLRKKSMKSIADEGQEEEYGADDYIDTTPNTSMGAQSAIRRESNSLSDYYKTTFKENRAMKSSAKFSWDNIRADFEETDNDLGALGKAIKENKNFAPADQLGDIFKHLSETAENAAQDAVDDDFMEFDESEIVDGATAFTESEEPKNAPSFNWRKMAESAGADMLRGIMESKSIDSGANIDISSAQDVAGDAIRMARGK